MYSEYLRTGKVHRWARRVTGAKCFTAGAEEPTNGGQSLVLIGEGFGVSTVLVAGCICVAVTLECDDDWRKTVLVERL